MFLRASVCRGFSNPDCVCGKGVGGGVGGRYFWKSRQNFWVGERLGGYGGEQRIQV